MFELVYVIMIREMVRENPMPNSETTPDLWSWSQKFTAYLDRKSTDPSLRSLLVKLGYGGRRKVARSIFDYLRPELWSKFRSGRRRTGKEVDKSFVRVIRILRKAAKEYDKLGRLAPEIGWSLVLGWAAPEGFADGLNTEADRLVQQQKLARIYFSKKRSGNKYDLFILVNLQDFVDEFCRRSRRPLANGRTRHLSPTDLADLIEAGKSAFGIPENKIAAEVAAIERALQRFRAHPDNSTICDLSKLRAIKLCNKLRFTAPVSASPAPPDTKPSEM